MKFWLIKSDPDTFSWTQFVDDGKAVWDGVRNYQARNFLKDMKIGDKLLFYHSNIDKAIFGVAEVVKTAYPDPTTDDDRWVAIDTVPLEKFKNIVTLKQIKEDILLKDILLVKQMRLSVMPLKQKEFEYICALGMKNE